MKKATTCLLILLFAGLGVQEAKAQFQIGPRIGYDFSDIEHLFIGAEGRFTPGSIPVILNPVFDIYLTDDNYNFLQVSFNGLYEFGGNNGSLQPYAGAGISITRVSIDVEPTPFNGVDTSNTEVGVNLIGGATFSTGNLKPFAQLQVTVGDVDILSLAAGLLFTLGGNK